MVKLENVTIKVDVDGVLRDSFRVMCNLYNREILSKVQTRHVNKMTTDKIFDYDVEVSFPEVRNILNISAAQYFFEEHAEEVFGTAPAYKNATFATRFLHQQGARIEICSWQPNRDGRLQTIRFLENNDIYFDGLHFTNEKWRVQCDWMIDDALVFLNDSRDSSAKICISHPFNASFEGRTAKSIWDAAQFLTRVYSIN